MGLRSAAIACQRPASAVSWISRQQGRSLFNYLDDFIGVSSSSTATNDFQSLLDLLTSLGLQESSEISCSPSPVMICLGVQLDTNNLPSVPSVSVRLRHCWAGRSLSALSKNQFCYLSLEN